MTDAGALHGLADRFEADRPHLRAVAQRILGSPHEAEDAVQEAWVRLSRTDTSEVANLTGWLTTVVSRVCLDMLRSRAARREDLADLPEAPAPEATDPEREALMADAHRPRAAAGPGHLDPRRAPGLRPARHVRRPVPGDRRHRRLLPAAARHWPADRRRVRARPRFGSGPHWVERDGPAGRRATAVTPTAQVGARAPPAPRPATTRRWRGTCAPSYRRRCLPGRVPERRLHRAARAARPRCGPAGRRRRRPDRRGQPGPRRERRGRNLLRPRPRRPHGPDQRRSRPGLVRERHSLASSSPSPSPTRPPSNGAGRPPSTSWPTPTPSPPWTWTQPPERGTPRRPTRRPGPPRTAPHGAGARQAMTAGVRQAGRAARSRSWRTDGDPADRLGQVVGGQRERQPQEALQRAVEAEPGAGREPHADVLGRPGQRAGDRPVQLGPERHAAGRDGEPPLRQHARAAPRPARRGGRRSCAAAGRRRSSSAWRSRLHRDELVEHRAGHVDADPQRGQPLHQRRRRAHPADPQATPVRPCSCRRSTTTRECRSNTATGGGIAAPSSGRSTKDSSTTSSVPVAWAVGDQPLAQLGGHQVAGRVVELRDHVRQPGPGLPQRAEQQLAVPAGRRRRGRGC